jgi:histidine triad (HIT) family protein
MPTATQCAFCELVRGAGEASVCYEDSVAIAFMDIQPVNAGHVLVAPRRHFESLEDLPAGIAMHLFEVALRLEPAVRTVTGAEGMNMVVNSGRAAGQDVFHYHVHLIPRRTGDGFDIPLPFPESAMPNRMQLDACAARIIAASHDSTGAMHAHDPVDVAAD